MVNDAPQGPTKIFKVEPLQGPWDIRLTLAQVGGTTVAVRWFAELRPGLTQALAATTI